MKSFVLFFLAALFSVGGCSAKKCLFYSVNPNVDEFAMRCLSTEEACSTYIDPDFYRTRSLVGRVDLRWPRSCRVATNKTRPFFTFYGKPFNQTRLKDSFVRCEYGSSGMQAPEWTCDIASSLDEHLRVPRLTIKEAFFSCDLQKDDGLAGCEMRMRVGIRAGWVWMWIGVAFMSLFCGIPLSLGLVVLIVECLGFVSRKFRISETASPESFDSLPEMVESSTSV